MNKINSMLEKFLRYPLSLQNKITKNIASEKSKDILRIIYYGKKSYFPFDLWETLGNILLQEPYVKIIKSWPNRLIHMLRAMDVIHNFRPVQDIKSLKVLEIGSGPAILTGLMANIFSSKHVLVDLPEQIAVGFSFLSEFFPDIKILLPNEVKQINWNKADVIFITPNQLSVLKKSTYDVGINMFSYQEMSPDTVEEYFTLLRKCLKLKNIFYCINRVSKTSSYDNTVSEFSKYPWEKDDVFLHDAVLPNDLSNFKIVKGGFREAVVCLKK